MPLTSDMRRTLRAIGYRFTYDDTRQRIVAEAPRLVHPPLKDKEFSYE